MRKPENINQIFGILFIIFTSVAGYFIYFSEDKLIVALKCVNLFLIIYFLAEFFKCLFTKKRKSVQNTITELTTLIIFFITMGIVSYQNNMSITGSSDWSSILKVEKGKNDDVMFKDMFPGTSKKNISPSTYVLVLDASETANSISTDNEKKMRSANYHSTYDIVVEEEGINFDLKRASGDVSKGFYASNSQLSAEFNRYFSGQLPWSKRSYNSLLLVEYIHRLPLNKGDKVYLCKLNDSFNPIPKGDKKYFEVEDDPKDTKLQLIGHVMSELNPKETIYDGSKREDEDTDFVKLFEGDKLQGYFSEDKNHRKRIFIISDFQHSIEGFKNDSDEEQISKTVKSKRLIRQYMEDLERKHPSLFVDCYIHNPEKRNIHEKYEFQVANELLQVFRSRTNLRLLSDDKIYDGGRSYELPAYHYYANVQPLYLEYDDIAIDTIERKIKLSKGKTCQGRIILTRKKYDSSEFSILYGQTGKSEREKRFYLSPESLSDTIEIDEKVNEFTVRWIGDTGYHEIGAVSITADFDGGNNASVNSPNSEISGDKIKCNFPIVLKRVSTESNKRIMVINTRAAGIFAIFLIAFVILSFFSSKIYYNDDNIDKPTELKLTEEDLPIESEESIIVTTSPRVDTPKPDKT